LATGSPIGCPLGSHLAVDYADPYLTNKLGMGDNPNNANSRADDCSSWFSRSTISASPSIRTQPAAKCMAASILTFVSYKNPDINGLTDVLPGNLDFFGTCPGCDRLGYKRPASDDFYTGAADTVGHNWESTLGETVTIKYKFEDINLTSISDLTKYTRIIRKTPKVRRIPIRLSGRAVNTTQVSEESISTMAARSAAMAGRCILF